MRSGGSGGQIPAAVQVKQSDRIIVGVNIFMLFLLVLLLDTQSSFASKSRSPFSLRSSCSLNIPFRATTFGHSSRPTRLGPSLNGTRARGATPMRSAPHEGGDPWKGGPIVKCRTHDRAGPLAPRTPCNILSLTQETDYPTVARLTFSPDSRIVHSVSPVPIK